MATRSQHTGLPAPPRYTGQDTDDYRNALNLWLVNLDRHINNINYLRGNGLYLPGLPTIGDGLRAGEVFSRAGVLTIVGVNDIWAGTLSATCKVGTVTVTP